jgi:hypothetical protein
MSKTHWIADADLEWEILDDYCKRKIMAYTEDLMIVKVHFKKEGILVDSFTPMRADFIP